MNPVQRAHALRPVLGQLLAAAAHHVEPGAAFVFRAHLKAGGIDNAVDLVLLTGDDKALLGDAPNALAAGVH